MWSNLYWYYEIRGNAAYSRELSTQIVLKVLEDTGVLVKKHSQQYSTKEGLPWMDISAVDSKDGCYGHPRQFNSESVNLIVATGSKHDPENERFYIELLRGIAEKINWEFILEEDDEENEDVVLRAIEP